MPPTPEGSRLRSPPTMDSTPPRPQKRPRRRRDRISPPPVQPPISPSDPPILGLTEALGLAPPAARAEEASSESEPHPLLRLVLDHLSARDLGRAALASAALRSCSDRIARFRCRRGLSSDVRPMVGQSWQALLHGTLGLATEARGWAESWGDGVRARSEGYDLGVPTRPGRAGDGDEGGDLVVLVPFRGGSVPVYLKCGDGRGCHPFRCGIGGDVPRVRIPRHFPHLNAYRTGWIDVDDLIPPGHCPTLLHLLQHLRTRLEIPHLGRPHYIPLRDVWRMGGKEMYEKWIGLCVGLFKDYRRLGQPVPCLDVVRAGLEAQASELRLELEQSDHWVQGERADEYEREDYWRS